MRVFCALAILAILCSCAPSLPKIANVYSQVNRVYSPKDAKWQERLAVYVLAENPDGIEDLDRLYIINDAQNLFWALDKDDWLKAVNADEIWIGSSELMPPDGNTVPRGDWRLELVTRAGEKAFSAFALNTPPLLPEQKPPSVSMTSSTLAGKVRYRVVGMPSHYLAWAKGPENEFLSSQKLTIPEFTLDGFSKDPAFQARIASLMFYSYDKPNAAGLLAGPYVIAVQTPAPSPKP